MNLRSIGNNLYKGIRFVLSGSYETWLFIKPNSHYILIGLFCFIAGYAFNDYKYGNEKLRVAKEGLEAVTSKAEYEARKEEADSMREGFLRLIETHIDTTK